MSNEELKEALMNRRPVIVTTPLIGEIEYKYVSAIIYRRKDDGTVDVAAEVLDKCLHSVCIVDPKHIQYKEAT